jgi:hypothetical protein
MKPDSHEKWRRSRGDTVDTMQQKAKEGNWRAKLIVESRRQNRQNRHL